MERDRLLVTALGRFHILERQRLLMERWRLRGACELPGCDVRKTLVIPFRLALFRLIFFPEVAAARFFPVKGVADHELGQLHEVCDPSAFSISGWKLSALPGITTFFQNSSRRAGIWASAFLSPASFLAIPQRSHMSFPRSLWNSSTVRFPLMAKRRFVVSSTFVTAAFAEGSSFPTGLSFDVAR